MLYYQYCINTEKILKSLPYIYYVALTLNFLSRRRGMDNHDRFWLTGHGCLPSPYPILGGPRSPHGSYAHCCPNGSRGPSGLKVIVSSCTRIHYRNAKAINTSSRRSFTFKGSSIDLRPEDIRKGCHTRYIIPGRRSTKLLKMNSRLFL